MSHEVKVVRITFPPAQTPCRYFRLRGYCSRGSACQYRHSKQDVRPQPLCIFFNNGFCRYGDACRFAHVASIGARQPIESRSTAPPQPAQQQTLGGMNRRINGAQVTFGLGVEVTSLELPQSLNVVTSLNSNVIACVWKKVGPDADVYFETYDDAIRAQHILQHEHGFHGEACENEEYYWADEDVDFACTVKLHDLPYGTTEFDLRQAVETGHNGPVVEDIVMINTKQSSYEDLEAIKHFFSREGKVTSYRDNFKTQSASVRMTMEFENAEDMRTAIRKYHRRYIPALRTKLFVYHMITISQNVRASIFRVLADDYMKLRDHIRAQFNVLCREFDKDHHLGRVQIKISGYDKRSLAQAKDVLNKFFAGTIAQDEGKILWHSFFAQQPGLQFLKTVMESSRAYVFCNRTNYNLELFGSPAAKSEALALLMSKLEELQDHRLMTVIRSTEYDTEAFNEIFQHLLWKFGPESVTMQRISDTKFRVKIRVVPFDVIYLESYLARFRKTQADSATLCSICWSAPDEPLTLPCDHVYCTDCFTSQCEASTDSQFPVRCFAGIAIDGTTDADGICNRKLPLFFLLSTLPATAFEGLLRRAVNAHVKKNHRSFRYCPTADCHHLYAPIDPLPHTVAEPYKPTADNPTDPSIFTCSDCFQSTCRRCHTQSHPWLQCEEAVDLQNGGELAFKRWKTSRRNVKDCPSCQSTIEKVDGCNHMYCTQCKAHICWFCLEFFDDPDSCYTHMEEKHENGDGVADGAEVNGAETEDETGGLDEAVWIAGDGVEDWSVDERFGAHNLPLVLPLRFAT